MKGTAKSKVVTSGRLSGRVKVQPARRRVAPNPGTAAPPEPAYSLYSTDSEDQVTSLHRGLDRCAALLGGILQAERAEASLSPPTAWKAGAAKSRPSAPLGKKSVKLPAQTESRGLSAKRAPGCRTPRSTPESAARAAHSGVKLHPPRRRPLTPQALIPPAHRQTLQNPLPTTAPPQPQTSTPPHRHSPHSGHLPPPRADCQPTPEAPHTHCETECDREEEEEEEKEEEEEDFVPVRDVNAQSTAADTHTHSHSHSHTPPCVSKLSDMQLERGQACEDTHSGEDSSADTDGKVKTVQYLLGELKALITGRGSVAERLLSHLEQTVSSTLISVSSSDTQTETDLSSVHSQNTQLRRRVRILQQQLKEREKAERQRNMETLCHSEVLIVQDELSAAESRLQELQDDLTGLRKALQDTQSQLRDREAETTLLRTDLEATRSRLMDSEREKSELVSLAQQRLEEIEQLKRSLQSPPSSDCPTVVDSSVCDPRQQHRPDPAEPPTDRITQYLISLGQLEPAERQGDTLEQRKLTSVQLRHTSPHPDVRSQRGVKPAETSARPLNPHLDQSCGSDKVQSEGRLSQCDVESVWSDWSTRSGSTFDTRDEAAFRDGLSALDASIASLQKTIQLDLRR